MWEGKGRANRQTSIDDCAIMDQDDIHGFVSQDVVDKIKELRMPGLHFDEDNQTESLSFFKSCERVLDFYL